MKSICNPEDVIDEFQDRYVVNEGFNGLVLMRLLGNCMSPTSAGS